MVLLMFICAFMFVWGCYSKERSVVLFEIASSRYDPHCTLVSQNRIKCVEIPYEINNGNITDVIVTKHSGELNEELFMDKSWSWIKIFQLNGPSVTEVPANVFENLRSLKELILSFRHLQTFSTESFVGLNNLQILRVLQTSEIETSTFLRSVVANGSLPNLIELTFDPGVHFHNPVIQFSSKVTNCFLEKPLSTLNISNSAVIISFMSIVKLMFKVKVLNISGSNITPIDIHVPKPDKEKLVNNGTVFMTTLDISGIISPYFIDNFGWPSFLDYFDRLIPGIENLYADGIPKLYLWKNKGLDFRNETVFTKRIFLRNNQMERINMSLLLPENNAFTYLDLSNNTLEYISPKAVSTAIHLEEIYLTQNRLSLMEHMPEFEELFKPLKNLLILELAANKLTRIPWTMFEENEKLRVLNLSFNNLKTINFNLSGLLSLQLFDLRNNKIISIDGNDLTGLGKYLAMKRTAPKHEEVHLILTANPFACTCKSLRFVKWFVAYLTQSGHDDSGIYFCSYENSGIEINSVAIDKIRYLCSRTRIIAGSVGGCSVATTLFISVFLLWRKRRKGKQKSSKEDNFKVAFRSGELTQCYIVFAAYAGRDEEMVSGDFLSKLGVSLQRKIRTDKRVICTGDDFRPGFPIVNETYRTVQHSCVFVGVISQYFCQSKYCKAEIQEACNQDKPIILVFVGNVDDKDMSPYIREIFQRKARAKLVRQHDGRFELVPNLETITDAIIDLAVEGTRL